MNEQCDDSTRRFPWRWGVVLVVMLVLYVASFGPAIVAVNELGLIDNRTAMRCLNTAYYPRAWIASGTDNWTWLESYTSWCSHLWNEVLDP